MGNKKSIPRKLAALPGGFAPHSKQPKHLPFLARFDSRCFQCDQPIKVGETIKRAGERYAHAACLSSEHLDQPIRTPEQRNLPEPKREPKTVRWIDLLGHEHFKEV